MIKENFRTIEYSDKKYFIKKDNRVELKEFSEDLIFAINFDNSFEAIKGNGLLNPYEIIGSPLIADYSAFGDGKHCQLSGGLVYNKELFTELNKEGCIKFRLKSGFNNAKAYQFFKTDITDVIDDTTSYGFSIYIDNELENQYIIDLNITDEIGDIFNKVATAISLQYDAFLLEDKIQIQLKTYGNEILIKDHTNTTFNSLIDLLGGLEPPKLLNGPNVDLTFLSFTNRVDNKNKIELIHNTDSELILMIYDENEELKVNENLGQYSNNPNKWYDIELSFNENIGQIFINGKLLKVFITGFEYISTDCYLLLFGEATQFHRIDEIQIFNEFQHNKNFDISTTPISKYNTTNPYIDINFGKGLKNNLVRDIYINGTDNLHYTIKVGNSWYYYFNNNWRVGTGDFDNTNTEEVVELNFNKLFFNDNFDLIIRIYFNSNGWNIASVDEVSILTDAIGETAANITGEIKLNNFVDLSTDKFVIISTDKETVEVDLSSAALDDTMVSLEEIKQAILDANIEGLSAVTDDGNSRLVLIAETLGDSSYISISEGETDSALHLIWGEESHDTGEESEATVGLHADYSELFRWVRGQLGYPLVPVELTDEQLEDCLSEALYHYNKWRNFNEDIAYVNLSGNGAIGWEIPPIVGGGDNIVDVILRPRYPLNYYSGRDDIISNLFVQQMFDSAGQLTSHVADYHIALSTMKDLNILLNNTVTWEIINRRLHIKPIPTSGVNVAIKFKSALSIDEVVNSISLKRMTLALAKIVLGGIRSTFGNQVPGGEGMIQLNGSELKSEGAAEKESLLQIWRSSCGPFEILIG